MAREKKDMKKLYNDLWNGVYTLIDKPRFNTIDIVSKIIEAENVKGDIVECGVWRGGMSVYLAYTFPERTIWVADSFEGFQNNGEGDYVFEGHERHQRDFDRAHAGAVRAGMSISIGLDEVKGVFKHFGLEGDDKIEYLKGWVCNTLDPKTCPIKEIALLRVDVDAYAATLEVLENTYDKVPSGGFVVFDDSALHECQAAITKFKETRGIVFDLTYPSGRVGNNLGENGGYFRKP